MGDDGEEEKEAGGKMQKIVAIAITAARAALRSRFVLSLAALLLLTVWGLPAVIRGDGTLPGRVQILLRYTLGLAALILAATTLWASALTVSREIDDRTLRLLVVKPVHGAHIWLGKWVGLTVVNAALLALVALAVYGRVQWIVNSGSAPAAELKRVREEILVGRRRIAPPLESIDDEVEARLKAAARAGRLPGGTSAAGASDELREEVRKAVLGERLTVAAGHSRNWPVAVPLERSGSGRGAISLTFRLSLMTWSPMPVRGEWSVETSDGHVLCRVSTGECSGGTHHLELPDTLLDDIRGVSKDGAGTMPLVLRFTNEPHGTSPTALFDYTSPVELLVRETGFGTNLMRAAAVLLSLLALLAAFGLTASTVFSPPVAVFTAVMLVAITLIGHYYVVASSPAVADMVEHHRHHGEEPHRPGMVEIAGGHVAGWLDRIFAPALEADPLTRLSDGVLITPFMAWSAVALLAGLYPAVLAALSGAILARRELALSGR